MARIDVDHMRVGDGHLVSMKLSAEQLKLVISLLRTGVSARRHLTLGHEPELVPLGEVYAAAVHLEALSTEPIEPNHP